MQVPYNTFEINKYNRMKDYTYKFVSKKGKLDGRDFKWSFWPFQKSSKEPYPPIDQTETTMFENELIEVGQQEIISLCADWKNKDKDLKAEYCKILHLKEDASERLEQETKDVVAAKAEFKAIQTKLSEISNPFINKNFELIILLFIALVELPLNSIAFQIFGASKVETYLMAAGMCVIVPLLGFIMGRSLKQTNKSLTDKILLVVIPLGLLLLIIALAIFRETLFETMQSNSILKINLSPKSAAFLFIIINLALVLGAVLVTYAASYANHSEYVKFKKIFKNALLNFKKESNDAEIAARDEFKASQLEADRRQRRQKLHDIYFQRAHEIKERFEWLIRAYRTANIYARPKGGTPPCFNKDPKILEIPKELLPENLDWNCPNYNNEH